MTIQSNQNELCGGTLRELHKLLLKVRNTEEVIAERYREQEMRTPVHLGTGQEAIAVGVCAALRQDDVIFSHPRCHNHYLAKGGSTYKLAAELYGRATGCSGGRGGSVHLTDRENGVVATTAILGEAPALAAGAALSFQLDGLDNVAVAFFGEGSMDEGGIYETFNFASVRNLPVLFVCENNLYATETPIWVRQADGTSLSERAEAFKVSSKCIDGNDVALVYSETADIVQSIREGNGPFFLECMTYRWKEHVGPMYDHEAKRTFRSRQEVERWMDRCPIKRSSAKLLASGQASREELVAWQQESETRIRADIQRASEAPWPDVATLFDNI